MEDDSSKEHVKSVTQLHLASFCKTLSPLIIVHKQAKGKTGFFKSVALDVVDFA